VQTTWHKLLIWAGEKGSPAYLEGTFIHDGNPLTRLAHPGGGGYDLVMRAGRP